ncbi:hypothetical protein AVEN_73059-1 [Araneus ventricosus]|uniref:Uncharacterized protein n=1 Tax=Araneus ventricosus TaxID=182803 RepID=A0A4Y2TG15_ARAVE|nr:hypothetical protein AVEN_73059-1 [Araneus ventricosus]
MDVLTSFTVFSVLDKFHSRKEATGNILIFYFRCELSEGLSGVGLTCSGNSSRLLEIGSVFGVFAKGLREINPADITRLLVGVGCCGVSGPAESPEEELKDRCPSNTGLVVTLGVSTNTGTGGLASSNFGQFRGLEALSFPAGELSPLQRQEIWARLKHLKTFF